MAKRAETYIPDDVQAAAKAAKVSTPLMYLGRPNGYKDVKLKSGLRETVAKAPKKK